MAHATRTLRAEGEEDVGATARRPSFQYGGRRRRWFELNNKFRTVETDDFVITPNHIFTALLASPMWGPTCVSALWGTVKEAN
jgi:hypothetical protein